MKILTAAQMQRIDRLTTERYGVPSLTLMENAGRSFVEFLVERFSPLEEHRIVILCGRGNNGGDGMVVARLLREKGCRPRVLLLADPKGLRGDAAVNWERLAASGTPEVVEDSAAWQRLKSGLADATLVVDALFGTGLTKPVEGFLAEVIRDLNAAFPSARVVAVDLPSGVSADTGELIGECVRADASVTFTAPKVAHVFPPACERVGEWVVKAIGTPAEALENDPELQLNLTCREDLAWLTVPAEARGSQGQLRPCPNPGGIDWQDRRGGYGGQGSAKGGRGLGDCGHRQERLAHHRLSGHGVHDRAAAGNGSGNSFSRRA